MGKHSKEKNDQNEIYSSRKAAKSAKKHKNRKKKVIISLLSVIIVCCSIIASGILFFNYYFGYTRVDVDIDALGVNTEDSEDHIVNIALFGIDTRNMSSMKGLSDSIMVMSVDKKAKKIKLISVMRDSVVMVEGKRNKINAAYSGGGPERAIKTLNTNFKLDITDYATVNFDGMAKLIDKVGGVEVNVTEREINDPSYNFNITIREQAKLMGIKAETVKSAGLQTLMGNQAVAWARIRHLPTAEGERDDYGRTARQRTVMMQLFSKAKSAGWTKIPGMAKSLLPYVETSLTYKEIIGLAPAIVGGGIEPARIPYDGCVINGGGGVRGGVYYNLDYATSLMKAFIYEDIPFDKYVEQNPIVKTGW